MVDKERKRKVLRHKTAQEDGSQSQSQPSQKKPLHQHLLMPLKLVSMLLAVPALLQAHGEPSPMLAPQLVPTTKTSMETVCAHQVNLPTSQSQRGMLPQRKVVQLAQQLAVHQLAVHRPEAHLLEAHLLAAHQADVQKEMAMRVEMGMATEMAT